MWMTNMENEMRKLLSRCSPGRAMHSQERWWGDPGTKGRMLIIKEGAVQSEKGADLSKGAVCCDEGGWSVCWWPQGNLRCWVLGTCTLSAETIEEVTHAWRAGSILFVLFLISSSVFFYFVCVCMFVRVCTWSTRSFLDSSIFWLPLELTNEQCLLGLTNEKFPLGVTNGKFPLCLTNKMFFFAPD